MEPIFLVEVQCPLNVVSKVYSVLNARRGKVVDEIPKSRMDAVQLKAHLPVAESFGFTQLLRSSTGGKAFPQCSFSHWQLMDADFLDESGKYADLVASIRRRKGLKELTVPPLDRFLDRL